MSTEYHLIADLPIADSMARADDGDATAIVELRDGIARWQLGRGIDQWTPGEVALDAIARQIAREKWWVLRSGSGLIAAVRLYPA